MKIGLAYDLRSDYLALGWSLEDVVEFDTEETIELLEKALRELGHDTERIGNGRALAARLVAGDRWDLVFNIAEGWRGRSREAQVPALLELFEVGYTFSDPLACAITLDKAAAKRIVRDHGMLTPEFFVARKTAELDALCRRDLPYPLFAKPLAEGTGKGIDPRSRLAGPDDLRAIAGDLLARYGQPVLVEEFLPGREFTVGLLGNGPQARALGTMEIVVHHEKGEGIYTFENKQQYEEYVDYRIPDRTPLIDEVERLAVDCFRALECRDCARADIRLDRQGRPSFLEINPLPGLNAIHSDLPIIAEMLGISFRELIREIVESACDRLGMAS
jgi:D-alanine-D-alanine ligase